MPFEAAVSRTLALHASGDVDGLRALLRRVDLGGVEKEQAGRMAVLFSGARAADDPQLLLSIAREWLRLDLEHKTYQYQLQERVASMLGAMDAETGLALGRYFVGRVLEDPEANSQYVTILPQLARQVGGEVVEPEAVRTLLDEFGQTYAYGLGPVLALLPPADRAGALRGVWSKLEASGRADFLLGLVSESTEEVPEELAEFIVESCPPPSRRRTTSSSTPPASCATSSTATRCARLARIVLEAKPQLLFMEGIELLQPLACWERRTSSIGRPRRGSSSRPTRRTTTRCGGPATVCSTASGRTRRSIPRRARCASRRTARRLHRQRGSNPDRRRPRRRARADLDAALAEEPEDEELLNRLRRVHLQRGERIAAAEVLERLASVAEKTGDERTRKRHLKRLVTEWKGQRAPERALAAQEALGGRRRTRGPSFRGCRPASSFPRVP